MRALLQRVSHASVAVEGETVGKTGAGFLILLGVMQGDTDAQAGKLAEKPPCCACLKMRRAR